MPCEYQGRDQGDASISKREPKIASKPLDTGGEA